MGMRDEFDFGENERGSFNQQETDLRSAADLQQSRYFRQRNDGAATAFPTGQVQPELPGRFIQPSQQDEQSKAAYANQERKCKEFKKSRKDFELFSHSRAPRLTRRAVKPCGR